jgi:alginate O-acetyltransferase complex protein AlgI
MAMFAVFVVSGLIHELVISVPAGAGYGLPSAYFLLQGIGVVLERGPVGRRLGLSSGLKGWFFVFLFTTPLAYYLFHPAFVRRVIVPFLDFCLGGNT